MALGPWGPLISANENNGSLLHQGPLLSVMHQVYTHTHTHFHAISFFCLFVFFFFLNWCSVAAGYNQEPASPGNPVNEIFASNVPTGNAIARVSFRYLSTSSALHLQLKLTCSTVLLSSHYDRFCVCFLLQSTHTQTHTL